MKTQSAVQELLGLLSTVPRARVAGLFVLMVLGSLSEGFGVLLLVPLLNRLQHHGPENDGPPDALSAALAQLGAGPLSIGGFLLLFVVLVVIRCTIQYGREQLAIRLQHEVVDHLRQSCFRALLRVEWCWIASKKQADHASLLLNDVNRVGIGLNHGLGLLATLATMTVYLGTAFLLSWTMAGLALLSAALVMGLLRGQRRHALKLGQGLSAANRAMQGNVQESLSAIKLAKILGSENLHLNAFQGATSRLRAQQLEFSASTSLSRALFQAAGVTLLATYLYVGLSLWQAPLAELLTLVLIFARLIPLFVVLQQQQHQWLHMRAALLETRSLLAHCLAAAEPEAEPKVHASPWPVHQAICLRGISVHYAERRMPALDNLTVRLAARSTTAIIGASGAGKSTLADVLMGLLIPDHGVIEIDGVVLGAAQRRYWRQSVAYVPQEVFLFNDSIRGNLLWGQPPAQDTDLERALRQAAADFVFHLPQGMDTLVGDGGVRLSGGERQRLALARALLRKPSLLILDEATSALDLESEARVREAIEKLQGELTVVIIGHRLPTLEHAEHVIVLDQGRVLNEGSWASLKATTGATI